MRDSKAICLSVFVVATPVKATLILVHVHSFLHYYYLMKNIRLIFCIEGTVALRVFYYSSRIITITPYTIHLHVLEMGSHGGVNV